MEYPKKKSRWVPRILNDAQNEAPIIFNIFVQNLKMVNLASSTKSLQMTKLDSESTIRKPNTGPLYGAQKEPICPSRQGNKSGDINLFHQGRNCSWEWKHTYHKFSKIYCNQAKKGSVALFSTSWQCASLHGWKNKKFYCALRLHNSLISLQLHNSLIYCSNVWFLINLKKWEEQPFILMKWLQSNLIFGRLNRMISRNVLKGWSTDSRNVLKWMEITSKTHKQIRINIDGNKLLFVHLFKGS